MPMDGKYQFVVGTSICKTRYIKLCSERKIEMKYKKKKNLPPFDRDSLNIFLSLTDLKN